MPSQTKEVYITVEETHRDSKLCQILMEKNKLLSEPASFNFLQESPQSQIISGSLSHGQANFYCLIIVQMLILFIWRQGSYL